jgi:hypothetical protein
MEKIGKKVRKAVEAAAIVGVIGSSGAPEIAVQGYKDFAEKEKSSKELSAEAAKDKRIDKAAKFEEFQKEKETKEKTEEKGK